MYTIAMPDTIEHNNLQLLLKKACHGWTSIPQSIVL